MKKIKSRPFSLIHITSKKSLKKIEETKGFKPSIHDGANNKFQWLGNGVYFWNINDDYAIQKGKNLVKGRNRFAKVVGIYINLEIEEDNYLDFDNQFISDQYEEFLKIQFPEYYKEFLYYKEIIYSKMMNGTLKTIDLNNFGNISGYTVDAFLNYIEERDSKKIDLLIGYFYQANKKKDLPLGRKDKIIPQFCVKNIDLINNCIDSWKIKNNI